MAKVTVENGEVVIRMTPGEADELLDNISSIIGGRPMAGLYSALAGQRFKIERAMVGADG